NDEFVRFERGKAAVDVIAHGSRFFRLGSAGGRQGEQYNSREEECREGFHAEISSLYADGFAGVSQAVSSFTRERQPSGRRADFTKGEDSFFPCVPDLPFCAILLSQALTPPVI